PPAAPTTSSASPSTTSPQATSVSSKSPPQPSPCSPRYRPRRRPPRPRHRNRSVTSTIFHLRQRSLARGNFLVLGSVLLTFWLSDFPHNRATLLLLIPTATVILGTIDTARCIRRRWDLYHGGVILCLYMD